MSMSPGDTVAGFRVLSPLGSGGMGEVYLVENPQLGRNEALKIISVSGAANGEFLRRFTNEARIAAALDHPNIITVHQYGIDDGKPWFTMSHIDGPDLTGTTLEPGEVATIVGQVASALDYAHERGVIHRDIKPANVMITRGRDGALHRVIVLDFGIARPPTGPRLTVTNAFVGTIAYTAPEVIGGGSAVAQSDQYSLACTAYRLLTGVLPYDGLAAGAMMEATLGTPPPPLSSRRPDLRRLDPVFARAMAKDPAARYPDCRAFARALDQALRSRPARRPATPPPRPGPTVSGPSRSGPAGSGPPSSGPPGSGPAVSGPPGSGPPVSGPPVIGPPVSGPSVSGPSVSGPSVSGPTGPGPAYSGASGSGPPWSGPPAAGPRRNGGPASPPLAPAFHSPQTRSPSGPAQQPGNQHIGNQHLSNQQPGDQQAPAGLYAASPVDGQTGHTAAAGAGVAGRRNPGKRKKIVIAALVSVVVLVAAGVGGWFAYRHLSGSDPRPDDPPAAEIDYSSDVVISSNHVCAIEDAQLYCWGANESGQLGTGNTAVRRQPQRVGLTDVTAVSAGSYQYSARPSETSIKSNTCAVADDKAYCWGANTSGQLGIGDDSTSDSTRPGDPIPGLSEVTDIGTSLGSVCAVAAAKLYCWGYNYFGQLGLGTPVNSEDHNRASPERVDGLDEVTGVAMQGGTVCAIAVGSLSCWGNNQVGQVGDGTVNPTSTPAAVPDLHDVTDVDVGVSDNGTTTCAIAAGAVYCWGLDTGDSGTTTFSRTPRKVSGLPGDAEFRAITVSNSAACVVADGDVYCWGNNSNGQLGTGGTAEVRSPRKVSGLSGVVDVDLKFDVACALTSETLTCWGYGADTRLSERSGDGGDAVTTPTEVQLR